MSIAMIHGTACLIASASALASLCCRQTEQWVPIPQGGSPCTAGASGQRQFCETGSVFTGTGLREQSDLRLARCFRLWSDDPSHYLHAQCNQIIPGFTQIGPPLPSGQDQCCYIASFVQITWANLEFSVIECDGDPCE